MASIQSLSDHGGDSYELSTEPHPSGGGIHLPADLDQRTADQQMEGQQMAYPQMTDRRMAMTDRRSNLR